MYRSILGKAVSLAVLALCFAGRLGTSNPLLDLLKDVGRGVDSVSSKLREVKVLITQALGQHGNTLVAGVEKTGGSHDESRTFDEVIFGGHRVGPLGGHTLEEPGQCRIGGWS